MVKSLSQFEHVFYQGKRTMQIGLPVVAAQLAQMSMGFVDTIMAGNLSARALAAVAVGTSLFIPILVFMIGILQVVNPIVAHHFGAERFEPIARNLWQVLWLSQILGWLTFFGLRQMEFIFHFMNVQPEIIPVAQGYLRAISWGVPAYFSFFALRFFNEGLSISKPSMYVAFVGMVLNVGANYTFMYGHFGFPVMGAVGCGWASTLVYWAMFAVMAWVTFVSARYKSFPLLQGFRLPRWRNLREILGIGLPNGVNLGVEVSMFAIAALLIGSMGVSMVAGHQIAINVASIAFMIPLGLAQATTARVGFAAGRNDIAEAKSAGYVGIGLAFVVMTMTGFLMFMFPEAIVQIYTDDVGVLEVAANLLLFAALFQISDGLQVSALGALRGLKDTRFPMMINVLAYWLVGLPLGYVLGVTLGIGPEGIWIGLIAGLTVAALFHNLRFAHLIKKWPESVVHGDDSDFDPAKGMVGVES